MSVPEPEIGLRERKRRATRRAIQQAALRIAIEQGLAAVTVDEISRRADVSPRTFFNYFPSKDEAILGDDPTLPDDGAVDAFVAGAPSGDLIADVGALLAQSTESVVADRDLLPERQQVLKENPQLFSQRMASMKEFQAQLAGVIARRLVRERSEDAVTVTASDSSPAIDPELERKARLMSLVAMAAVRHAWWEWSLLDDDDVRLVDVLRSSFDDLGALVSRTLV
ncbi:TetR/AcrR family transcriptional regulator [Curtobacterium sp. RRHDQ10]|uniref:TetR/AcrR family transcriptional regulator n=1 Tax=Curtobacterium phyllosphaerae TaxID=3413379 RepID=UPI003BF40BD4